MREIKFRAWTGKEMIKIGVINFENESAMDYYNFHDSYAGEVVSYGKNENGKLMQSTGLKDKNGKEIWEGDITKDIQDRSIGVVKWDERWMKWNIGEDGKWAEDAPYVRMCIEVIGNIYEGLHSGEKSDILERYELQNDKST